MKPTVGFFATMKLRRYGEKMVDDPPSRIEILNPGNLDV
jgi:hypothetical protein